MKIPRIISDWKPIFQAKKYGNYINDHTIIQECNGTWHLIGITGFGGGPSTERYFVHGLSEHLEGPFYEHSKVIDTGMLAWAPCVIEHEKNYYMYYGPSPTRMAVSPDLHEWFGYEISLQGNPPMTCHRDHFVLKCGTLEWLMYVSGIYKGRGCVSLLKSQDLLNWKFCGYALTSGPELLLKPAWGAFESPYIVKRDEWYYLFVTYTDCSPETYHQTLVFTSKDPCCFGCYREGRGGAEPVAVLFGHASEIITDGNGDDYITTCGWNGMNIPYEHCVSVAKLAWEDQ